MVGKLLDIFRVVHNYIDVCKRGDAPGAGWPGPLVLQGRAVLRVRAHEKGALGVAYFFVGG